MYHLVPTKDKDSTVVTTEYSSKRNPAVKRVNTSIEHILVLEITCNSTKVYIRLSINLI